MKKNILSFWFCISIFYMTYCPDYSVGADVADNALKSCQVSEEVSQKTRRHIVERKSIMLYSNWIYLMTKCDQYIESWNFRKNNLNLYLMSKGEFLDLVKSRRDLISEIEKKILLLEQKKNEYATIIGKLYVLSEPFIEQYVQHLSAQEIEQWVQNFFDTIETILPKEFCDNYFNEQLKKLKIFAPESSKQDRYKKYACMAGVSVIGIALLIAYRTSIYNLFRNFFENQVYKPLRNLKNCLFAGPADDDFLDMSPQELLKDLEAQKEVIKDKIKDLVTELDPEVSREALDGIIDMAKKNGLEEFVAQCIKKASQKSHGKTKSQKPGWIEWFFIGNKIQTMLGMSPKEKFLEIEIKGLLSRLAATRLLYEAKDGIDSNKLTIALGSLLPVSLVSYGCYKAYKTASDLYYGIQKKKRYSNEILFRMNDIINKNMGRRYIDDLDQGLLCYLAHQFKSCLIVVPEHTRSSFEKDLFYISSHANTVDRKLQILQSMKIMLYAR